MVILLLTMQTEPHWVAEHWSTALTQRHTDTHPHKRTHTQVSKNKTQKKKTVRILREWKSWEDWPGISHKDQTAPIPQAQGPALFKNQQKN